MSRSAIESKKSAHALKFDSRQEETLDIGTHATRRVRILLYLGTIMIKCSHTRDEWGVLCIKLAYSRCCASNKL
ncbi:hypothetical protein KIMH_04060 [Bombiscardovia apis]|uniref:Uncharacterized protein n=1 Tax=Bombiscardovia apis TaxID=2932182 RepID=A0ABM8BBR6_9BIFI|nr:hypothetical protein KIMH_04060 [Bombiscardovia apis]